MLSDKQFSFIESHLPQKRRPPLMTNREFLDAVLFVLSTGCQWRKLPPTYGNWHTIYTRFKRWSEKGIMQKVVGELIKNNVLDCSVIMIDSTVVRAHHSAAGAQKKRGIKASDAQKEDSQRRFMHFLLMKQPLETS